MDTSTDRLRRENKVLKMEREIPKKGRSLLRQGEGAKFAFIEVERATRLVPVECRVLRVSASGCYAWRKRPEASPDASQTLLAAAVAECHARSRGTPTAARACTPSRSRRASA